MASAVELQLLLKLNDQMSRGLKSALNSAQKESKTLANDVANIAKNADKIRPTSIMRLTDALNKAKSAAKSTMDTMQKMATVGASLSAGGYVLKEFSNKPIAFDRRLALLANTAFGKQDAAGRIAGKSKLESAVRAAQQQGLGSQDSIAAALGELIGSGAMGDGEAGVNSSVKLLPSIAKAATGTGSDISDMAKIAIAAKQNLKLTDDEIPLFLSKAITAGNEGGFEIKDMAKWLPAQMALYAANGMKGMRGGEDLLAYNQVSRISAGSADEAGNNFVNLLTKINSSDTQNDFKKQGIDLTGSLAAGREKGISTLDTFLMLVDKVASKDSSYKALEARLKNETGDTQKETLSAMMDILEQRGVGLTVQDRQALSALLAARQNEQKLNEVRDKVRNDNGGQVDTNYSVVRNTASGAAEALENAKDKAASDSLKAIDSPLQSLLNGATGLADKFPTLAAAAYGATTAIAAMGASAGVFSLLSGGAAGSLSRIAPVVGGVLTALGPLGIALAALGVVVGGIAYLSDKKNEVGKTDEKGHPGMRYYAHGGGWKKDASLSQEHADHTWKNLGGSRGYWVDNRTGEPVKVVVEVKNGNLYADVEKQTQRQGSRR